MTSRSGFEAYMREAAAARRLVLQPRMGFSTINAMRSGLQAVKESFSVPRIGTVTIDAYTRVGQIERATQALQSDQDLNGFPIVSHGAAKTTIMLDGLRDASFPVQVRHGTAMPLHIFHAAADAGFDAIEGGPVSYNLPYSRAPLAKTILAWSEAVRFWADYGERYSVEAHIETFAGCMLGQLCPPGLLIALSILEGRFFAENGAQNLSLSLAQGVNDDQDIGALIALSRLASRYFSSSSWHVVFYTFMGQFPRSRSGAKALIEDSSRIAVKGGAQRLIVKTAAEAHGIPSIFQNIEALQWARAAADSCDGTVNQMAYTWADMIEHEAETLVEATLALGTTCGSSLLVAFASGMLDIPYCPHPDNRNEARAEIDSELQGLVWTSAGRMPLRKRKSSTASPLSSRQFHDILDHKRRRYEELYATEMQESSL